MFLNTHVANFFPSIRRPSIHAPQDDLMDIDDDPIEVAPPPRRNPQPLLSESVAMNRFPLLDPRFQRGVLGTGSDFTNQADAGQQAKELKPGKERSLEEEEEKKKAKEEKRGE